MTFAIKASVDVRDALRRLNGIKFGKRNKILRTCATKAGRIVAAAAKAMLRDRRKEQKKTGVMRTGALRKSISVKVWAKEYTVMALIGPKKGFREQVGVRTRGGKNSSVGDAIHHDPVHIAHLVEFGHGGPHPAPAHAFMRPAWEANKARVQQIYADEIASGIAKLASTGAF